MSIVDAQTSIQPSPQNLSAYTYVPFPATSRISNYHIWIGICFKFIFEDNQYRKSFIEKTEPEWKNHTPLLNFLTTFDKKNVPFHILLEDVLRNCEEDDMNEIISCGQDLTVQFNQITLAIQSDINQFFSEYKIFSISNKVNKEAFKQWYDSKFESTSSVHRNAYTSMASGKSMLTRISVLLMIMPIKEKILATRSIYGNHHPTNELKAHRHTWYYNVQQRTARCTCGATKVIEGY